MNPRKSRLFSPSIQKTLFIWVLPTMIVGMILSLLFSVALLEEQAETTFDRTLAGVLQAINVNISTAHGGLALEEPFRLLEFFQLTATGKVYYHVATEDGLAEIGFPALPRPDHPLKEGQIYFTTGHYLDDEPVRTATLVRQLDNQLQQRIVVQVAESLEERHGFLNILINRTVLRDIFVLLLTALVLSLGITLALRPLHFVQQRLARRKENDVRPIDTTNLPQELTPLVDALNHQTQRIVEQSKIQQQFLHDASHQLKTPLSILTTQLNFAQREQDPNEIKSVLNAMHKVIQRTTRVTEQLLKLARAQHHAQMAYRLEKEPVALIPTIQRCIDDLELISINKKIDVVFHYEPNTNPTVDGLPLLIQEAITNLLDNALQYSPAESTITILLQQLPIKKQLAITIEDQGPGMSAHDLSHAGTRFRRGQSGKNHLGAGLGLAIVRTIVDLHQGSLQLKQLHPDGGLSATLSLPLTTWGSSSPTK